jgi:hypothetical protein
LDGTAASGRFERDNSTAGLSGAVGRPHQNYSNDTENVTLTLTMK